MAEKNPIQKFAHLIGLSSPSAAKTKAEDDKDERDKRDDESDDEHAARVKALDDDDKDKKDKDAKAAKKAKADSDEGDDDSDDAETKDDDKKAVRMRERNRCAAIFADPAAAANPGLAAVLAFGPSNLSRSAAIGLLQAGGATAAPVKRSSLDARMASVDVPVVGASPVAKPGAGALSVSDQIVAADRKARGEK